MTTTSQSSLDIALQKANRACQLLETHRPNLIQIEAARDALKDGQKILTAALELLHHACYTVAEQPPQPGVPLGLEEDSSTRGALANLADTLHKHGADLEVSTSDGKAVKVTAEQAGRAAKRLRESA